MDRLLWYLFAGSRGGPTRVRIVRALIDRPLNLHQLAKTLGMDYKTVDHNMRVLKKHVVVVCPDEGQYGALWHPSKNLIANQTTFEKIAEKVEAEGPAKGRKNRQGDLSSRTEPDSGKA